MAKCAPINTETKAGPLWPCWITQSPSKTEEIQDVPVLHSNHQRDNPWGQSSKRHAGSLLPFPGAFHHHRLCGRLGFSFPNSIPVSAQASAGWPRSSVASSRWGGSPTPAPCSSSLYLQRQSLHLFLNIPICFSFENLYLSASITQWFMTEKWKPQYWSFSTGKGREGGSQTAVKTITKSQNDAMLTSLGEQFQVFLPWEAMSKSSRTCGHRHH